MVWQRMMGRIQSVARRTARKRNRRLLVEHLTRRELLASDLGAIAGVAFVDEAADGFTAGDPPVLVDAGGNLVSPGTPGAQGIQIQLFEDTNSDMVFDAGDLLIGTDITDIDGSYRFDSLTAGRYFVQQQSVPQLNTPAAVAVDVTVVDGIQTALIDDYSTTTQSVTADSGTPTNSDSAAASEAIGGARDVEVTNTNGLGQLTVFVDSVTDTMSIGSLGDAEGTALIQYDGVDSTVTLDPTGLSGVSLAGDAPGSTLDPGAGLIVQTRADAAGDTLVITVYTDGSNSSTTSIPVPQDAGTFIETFVPFSLFATATGTGADFNNVGAIEASLALSANNDVFVSIVEARRPDVVQTDLANLLPVTLGGQLFFDNDASGGQNDGLREPSEAGITGVTVELYQLAGPTDVVDPTSSSPLTSTTTGAGGTYSFPGLDPGNYAVVVPSSMFLPGAALFGYANSTGNDPAPDPDDNVDDDDNGTTLPGGDVISGTITLESNNEPIDDDDSDPNTNTTVDFGFFAQIDLAITKTLNAAGSDLIAGGNVVFDIVVDNNGPLDATDVTITDIIPSGLTFAGTANPSGSFTTNVNGSTVEIIVGSVPAGTTATVQILADIGASQTADITNTASVSGFEIDIDPTNNSEDEVLDLPASDLRIEKSDATDPVNAGNQLVYTITVTNDGPDGAAGITVVDPLPTGVAFVSGNVDGNTSLVAFDSGTGEVTATVGTLANAGISVITVTVAVADNAASPLSNTATVSADPNTDPDLNNNSTAEDTTVERLVDVEVDKTVSGNPVAGQSVTYTVVVTNNGPSEARNVSVTDTLESVLTLDAGSFDPGTSGTVLSQNGQDLTFDVGSLSGGATATFSFDVSIASSAIGTVPNAATVTTTDTDSDATNDSVTVNMDVVRQVDLVLQKAVDLATAVPGQDQLVYTFTVGHDTNSPSDADSVVVTDTLPSGLVGAVISAPTADSTDFSNGIVTVGFDSIPAGEARTFTVTVDIDEAATGTVNNSASVSSAGTELDSSDNSDTASTALTPDFDVTISKSVDIPAPGPNDTITYTVGLANTGPSTAPGIILSDAIPTGLTFVSGTMNGQNATSDGTTITFPAITLGDGATASATLVFTVDASSSGTITNTASVPDLSAAGENDITNNSAAADVTIVPEADLGVSQTVSLADAQAGSDLTYTVTVTNSGPSQATNVIAVDTLPAGVTFVSGTGPNSEALTATGGVVNVNGGNLANAGTFSFTINATVATGATGIQTNSVTVSSDANDPNGANDTATAATTIDPKTSSIAGTVYLDANNNGIQDSGELGIAGVVLTLSGTDSLSNTVNATATTDANGDYLFANLAQGTYDVAETQPPGYRDGMETAGTGATSVVVSDNLFSQLGLAAETNAINFDFGELNEPLSKRRFLASS